jgi:tetratricopeptide (TPR) repeat protein
MAHVHARAFFGLAEHFFDAWEITPDDAFHARAEPELENFRAALCWALGARGDVLLGQRIACALRPVWFSFGAAEGRRWVQAARQRVSADTPDAILALLDLAEASLAVTLGENKASLALAERALARYRELDDPVGITRARLTMGEAQVYLGELAEGEALVMQALGAAKLLGLSRLVLLALDTLAFARKSVGDLPGVRQYSSEVLAVAATVGAERSAALTMLVLAEAEFQGGDAPTALRLADEALAVLSALGDTRTVAIAGYNMAAYLVALRRYDEARAAARRALPAARDLQFSSGLAWALQHLAAIASLRPNVDAPVEDRRRAAQVLGYVDARLNALEKLRTYTEQQEYDKMTAALGDALGEDELAKLINEGRGWSEDQAVAEAMKI